jgi:hypothetical protein
MSSLGPDPAFGYNTWPATESIQRKAVTVNERRVAARHMPPG